MQSESYRENLKGALENLISVNQSIYTTIINIAMQGELKEFNKSVPIGEDHQFEFAIFENSDDANIQLLIKLINTVDETYESIKNLNNIKLEEE